MEISLTVLDKLQTSLDKIVASCVLNLVMAYCALTKIDVLFASTRTLSRIGIVTHVEFLEVLPSYPKYKV